MTGELGLVHVERRRENLDVHLGFELGVDDEILIVLIGVGMNSRDVVLSGHKGEVIGNALNRRNDRLHVRVGNSVNLLDEHTTVQNLAGDHVLHHVELIIVRGSVHRLDNLRNQVGDTVPRQERLTERVVLNGVLVELLVVQNVERRANVGNDALRELALGDVGVVLLSLGKLHENLFDVLTELEHTFLKGSPRIVIELGGHNNATDTVDKGVDELILEGDVIHDDSANLANAVSVGGSNGDIVLIVHGSAVADSVQHVHAAVGQSDQSGLIRHSFILLSNTLFRREQVFEADRLCSLFRFIIRIRRFRFLRYNGRGHKPFSIISRKLVITPLQVIEVRFANNVGSLRG